MRIFILKVLFSSTHLGISLKIFFVNIDYTSKIKTKNSSKFNYKIGVAYSFMLSFAENDIRAVTYRLKQWNYLRDYTKAQPKSLWFRKRRQFGLEIDGQPEKLGRNVKRESSYLRFFTSQATRLDMGLQKRLHRMGNLSAQSRYSEQVSAVIRLYIQGSRLLKSKRTFDLISRVDVPFLATFASFVAIIF